MKCFRRGDHTKNYLKKQVNDFNDKSQHWANITILSLKEM